MPNGEWRWLSTITRIESNYIETEYYRTEEIWLMKIIEEQIANGELRTAHRTFLKQTFKNYNDTITNERSVVSAK